MRLLGKFGAFVLLVVAAPIAAALFGAVHDQLSYTLAPEYYTRLKFIQFGWAGVANMSPRMGAAVVGALSTWWVGLFAGVILAIASLRHPLGGLMIRKGARAFATVAVVALAVGLLGFIAGWVVFDPARDYVDWWRPAGLRAPRRFYAVGMLHNGSYLGGVIGVVVAAVRLWRSARVRNAPEAETVPAPTS